MLHTGLVSDFGSSILYLTLLSLVAMLLITCFNINKILSKNKNNPSNHTKTVILSLNFIHKISKLIHFCYFSGCNATPKVLFSRPSVH